MHYSALLAQRRVRSDNGSPTWEDNVPCLRIPTITGVYVAQEAPGGFTEATFTIPPDLARFDPEDLQFNTTCWLFCGGEPIFYGHVLKAIVASTREITVSLDGAYRKLDSTRMRIVWGDGDLTKWNPARGNSNSGSVEQKSDGSLRFMVQKGTNWSPGDFVAADYLLFDEAVGPRDKKLIDGIHYEQDSANYGGGNWEFRIYGQDSPGDTSPDLLFSAANDNPISGTRVADGSSGDDQNGWPSQSGYRCLRVGLYNTGAVTPASDRNMSFSVLRVSTRARTVKMLDQHQSSTLIGDIWDDAANGYDVHHLIQEEYSGSTGEAVVGSIPNNGQYVADVNFSDWTAPREMVETLAATDDSKVGMWFPTRRYPTGSRVVAASVPLYGTGPTKNYWYRQPAALTYEAWPALGNPDYYVRLQRGASWEPDGQGDELTQATYANYSRSSGRQLSVFVGDTSDDNWLYQQGWHEASDWQIDPPVGNATASTLAAQYNASQRQPTLSGTLTIPGDRPGAILGPGGAPITKLSTLKLGVVRIVDAKGPRAGRITRIEWTSRSAGQPEQAVLYVNSAASAKLDRHLNRLARRAEQQRTR